MQSGCISLERKQCNVTAVHKAGPQDEHSNYHPILGISVLTKTLENIVANQLDWYLETNQHLSLFQGVYH